MESIVYKAAPYSPTSPRSGDADPTLLRLKNMILTGIEPQTYLECYKGSLNLSETIPTLALTGTISGTINTKAISGAGTLFKSELRPGQWVFAGTEAFMVDKVISNTSLTVYRNLTVALVAATAYRMPVLFEINRKRGTLIQGNAVEFDKGNILGTGTGALRLNGSALSFVSVASSTLSVATGADDAGVGTVAWTNPTNITASGGGVASCVPTTTQITHYLKGTNCGFAIPGGATIRGIKVEIRKRINGAVTKVATDNRVRIVKASGAIGTTDKSSLAVWPSALTYSVYGGPTDLWGETWTPADINDADFGAVISATVTDSGVDGSTLEVDHMIISVYYTTSASSAFTGGPLIYIYDDATGTYSAYDLGMNAPTTAPTMTSVAGGTKNMQAGTPYSIRLVPSRTETNGYNNPGPKIEASIVTNNDRFEVDTTPCPMDSVHGQNEWDVYASESTSGGIQGPWFYVKTVTLSEIVAGKFYAEWNDAEIGRSGNELEFDNDAPPDSVGFVAVLEGNPVYISCFGPDGNSPGPSLVPAKPRNIEGAPAEWNVTSSPPETLIGVVTAMARLYCLTPKTLQQAIYAPTGDPLVPPISLRPYWKSGFANSHQLVFVNGQLIGYPHNGPTRSIADAEEATEEHAFGAYVAEIIGSWTGSHVLVAEDPDPAVNAVCFFHPADSKNAQGFWRTRVLVWGLRQNQWIGDVFIESPTRDMIVCGVATVDNHLEFLAGGLLSGSVQVDTYRWNTAAGSNVSYSAAWQLSNGGVSNQNKSVRYITTWAKLTSGVLRLFGFDSEININMTDIENGTNSQSGDISLGTQTDVQQLEREEMVFPDLALFTPQISGTWAGSGNPDRIDRVQVEFLNEGVRR